MKLQTHIILGFKFHVVFSNPNSSIIGKTQTVYKGPVKWTHCVTFGNNETITFSLLQNALHYTPSSEPSTHGGVPRGEEDGEGRGEIDVLISEGDEDSPTCPADFTVQHRVEEGGGERGGERGERGRGERERGEKGEEEGEG